MKRLNWAIVFILCVIGPTGLLHGQGTAFTYQGQLKEAGAPASGDYYMTFRVFDADFDGNQYGADYLLEGVSVVDGLFTVVLDFGEGVFAGTPLWLEIDVNAVVLSPRQSLTAAPYALHSARPWVTSGTDISYDAGYVGVGTNAPTSMLHIGGQSGVDGIKFPDGSLQKTAAIGGGVSPWSLNGTNCYYNAGKVGIGRSDPPDPLSFSNTVGDKISLYGDTGGTYGFGIQGGLLQIHSNNSSADIAFGYGPSATFTERMRVRGNGNVGIGISAPASKLTVVSTTTPYTIHGTAGANSIGVVGTATGTGARGIHGSVSGTSFCGASGDHQASQNYGLLGTLNEGIYARGVGTKRALTAISDTATAVHAESNGNFAAGVTGVSYHPSGFGGYFQNNAGGLALRCNGRASVAILEITGADLAEKFITSDRVEPGTVVEIDPDNSGMLRMAQGTYNRRVAGVVSGANDFAAGAILGHLPGMEDAPPIALSGRVWTYCDTTDVAIDLGDLLTTSDTPGHAMKAVDLDRSHGAVIGKAMTVLGKGQRGLVLVLVNLQ